MITFGSLKNNFIFEH